MTDTVLALNASRERPASPLNGYVDAGARFWSPWRSRRGACSKLSTARPDVCRSSALIGGVLLFGFVASGFYMLQPNQAAAITLFGSYAGTDRAIGPALGPAVADAAEGIGALAQFHFRQDQGQRLARQPDRDGGADRVARGRHRAGHVRRRRLQGLREGPGRGRDPHHRRALSLRRFRAQGRHASRPYRRGRRRA